MGEEYTVMYRWFNDYGYEADIAALREENPGLVSFEQYLRANGWENAGSSEGRVSGGQRTAPRSPGAARSCTMGA